MKKIFWVSIKVTSFDKVSGALTQISMVVESNDKIIDSIDLEINPFTYDRKIEVQPHTLMMNGQTQQQIMKYPNSEIQFKKMLNFLRKHSAQEMILGGHDVIQHSIFYIADWFKMYYVNIHDFFTPPYLDTKVLGKFVKNWGLLEEGFIGENNAKSTFELHQSIKQLFC
jgi:hypothetical protein